MKKEIRVKYWWGMIDMSESEYKIFMLVMILGSIMLSIAFYFHPWYSTSEDWTLKYLWVAGIPITLGCVIEMYYFLHKAITKAHKELEEQNKQIMDSIHYAGSIQKSLLPSMEELALLPNHFVLFQPKDVVSGDFYWMQHHNSKVYFAACDCTGHGVPGALMSMIGSSFLDEAVLGKGLNRPNEIFQEVRKGFISTLKQKDAFEQQKDGMDAVLCSWDQSGTLEYAAAYNPLLLIRNGKLLDQPYDKQPVGFHSDNERPYTHHELQLEAGDTIYLCSDGYQDQFGGPKNKKFMSSQFKKLLLSIQDKTMNEQKEILEKTLKDWMGEEEQVDDILVMGIRF